MIAPSPDDIDLSGIIKELEGQAKGLRERVKSFDQERARLAREAEKLERAVSILREGSGQGDPQTNESPEIAASPNGEGHKATRAAVLDVLRENRGEIMTVKEILEAVRLRGWLDPKIGAPIEAVRYAAKALAREHPCVYRVGSGAFQWLDEDQAQLAWRGSASV